METIIEGINTYDVYFNDESNSNNKGFKSTLDECISYINQHNGTDFSYFKDYKNGTVSVVCNETGQTVFETAVISPEEMEILSAMKTLIRDNEPITTDTWTGNNPSSFSEFAETNGFDLEKVVSVYCKFEDDLQTLYDECNN